MATVVIVPGAWGGAWEWTHVLRELRLLGHDVYALTLTGLGDRAHLGNADVTLATHARDVVEALTMENLSEVVLCAHSYGGFVVTEALPQIADRVAATLYLDAFVPEIGESLFDLVGDEMANLLRRHLRDGWAVPCPFRYEADVDLPADVAAWYNARSRPQPLRTFTDRVTVTAPAGGRRGYVAYVTDDDNQEPFLRISTERARSRGWSTRRLRAIHDAHITVPAQLAAVIDEFATA